MRRNTCVALTYAYIGELSWWQLKRVMLSFGEASQSSLQRKLRR